MSLLGRLGAVLGGAGRRGGGQVEPEAHMRPRVQHEEMPKRLYAIGDVHGCLHLLIRLEQMIMADLPAGEKQATLIYLGDFIDRGPASAGVIDHLLAPPPPGITRQFVAGNHEQAMLDFLDGADNEGHWLRFGGVDTLMTYGISFAGQTSGRLRLTKLRQSAVSHIPEEHVSFLRSLPVLHQYPGYVFVHAGVRVDEPLDRQSDFELMWMRDGGIGVEGGVVVHGHTPVSEPVISATEVNVDTGAYATGRLTALRLQNGEFHGIVGV